FAATWFPVAANEEWFYAPLDSIDPMPFHVLIKWRIINQAGFEGGTKIYINPFPPKYVKKQLAPILFSARNKGKISKDIQIDNECILRTNPLQYYKTSY
ncbi:MAG: DUF4921 family protein, partial [Verrucomicrobiota bacterium]|nr:DUF4921 family protein [Verrucomicrobiota bacterium]